MSGRAFRPARFAATEEDGVQTESKIMGRKTRRWWNRRHKRFIRIITLLEESNADPKRRNRKTRLREIKSYARAELARDSRDSKVVSNANQA